MDSTTDHFSNTHSGSNSTCVYHETHHCFAPNHGITSEDECYTREQLRTGICHEAGKHFNTVSAINQTLAPIIEVVASQLGPHLGM